jgi:hypothetical protein
MPKRKYSHNYFGSKDLRRRIKDGIVQRRVKGKWTDWKTEDEFYLLWEHFEWREVFKGFK